MRQTSRTWVRLCSAIVLAILIPSCGAGSDGRFVPPEPAPPAGGAPLPPPPPSVAEAEPNNAPASATPLPPGTAGTGSTSSVGDADFWSFAAGASNVAVRIELFGHRLAQAAWTAAANSPELALIAPNGATQIHRSFNLNAGDPDMPGVWLSEPGTYYLRVENVTAANPGGPYALRVTPLALTQTEVEPNDAPQTANALAAAAGTLAGARAAGTFDYFSLAVPANTWIDVQAIAYVNGGNPTASFDVELRLFAPDGVTLLAVHDDGRAENDSRVLHGVATAGTYFLRVQASGGAANGGRYLLQWSVVPFAGAAVEPDGDVATATPIAYGEARTGAIAGAADVDLFAFDGAAGDQVILHVLNGVGADGAGGTGLPQLEGATPSTPVARVIAGADGVTPVPQDAFAAAGAENTSAVVAILQSGGPHFVRVTGGAPTTYALRLVLARAGVPESEPNDALPIADALVAPGVAGAIGAPGDVDFHVFAAVAGELVVLRLLADSPPNVISAPYDGHGSTLQPAMFVYDAAGALVASSSVVPARRAQGLCEIQATLEIAFIASGTGSYRAAVTSAMGGGGATSFYLLSRD